MNHDQKKLEDYCSDHSSQESDLLHQIVRRTHLRTLSPQMLSGHLQGRLLSFLSKLINPTYILEVGTFTGYATICLLEGLSTDGKIITIEGNFELIPNLETTFSSLKHGHKINLIEGQALEIIPTLNHKFDMVFIDAAKNEYKFYFEMLIDKMNIGGVIIVDNVLWFGKVMGDKRDNKGIILDEFNKMVLAEPRVENMILPIRDGLQLIRKISD